MAYDFDLFVIGGGSGGVRAGRISAALGARVAICEDLEWGGTCVNVGCVPKKLFVYGSHFPELAALSRSYGWDIEVKGHDWAQMIATKNAEIERLNGIYGRMLGNAGCTVIDGHGTLVDPHTVRVGDTTYSAESILVATGGWPFVPDFPGKEHGITSNEVFYLPERPERVVIVGSGYIGVEFAGIFRGFGSKVDLISRGRVPLRGFDGDVRAAVLHGMEAHGVVHHADSLVARIEEKGGVKKVVLTTGITLEADLVLFATGRLPNTKGLGLDAVPLEQDGMGGIVIDEHWRTSVPSIYAVGDVTNRVQLTPVALEEGMQLARNLFAGQSGTLNYDNIPTAVFSQPPVGTVGLSEEAAHELHPGEHIDVYESRFTPMIDTMGERGPHKVYMKLVVHRSSDRVLGAHMVGDGAGEIIQGLGIALTCGVTKKQLDVTIGVHPTAAEEFVTMRTPRG